jgi:nitrogen fixation protein FixH
MKFNWGTGIALTFALFAAGIIFLVILSSRENTDLVSKDYYNKEIAFQSQIDKKKNADQLTQPLQVAFNKSTDIISISFPNQTPSSVEGKIHFFKPDNAALDFDVNIATNSSLQQNVNAEKMKKGLWRAQVDWKSNGKSFYEEKNVMID